MRSMNHFSSLFAQSLHKSYREAVNLLNIGFFFLICCLLHPPCFSMKVTLEYLKIEITTPYSAAFPARTTNKVMTCLCMWIILQQQSSNTLKEKYEITRYMFGLTPLPIQVKWVHFHAAVVGPWTSTPCWLENSVCVGRFWVGLPTSLETNVLILQQELNLYVQKALIHPFLYIQLLLKGMGHSSPSQLANLRGHGNK